METRWGERIDYYVGERKQAVKFLKIGCRYSLARHAHAHNDDHEGTFLDVSC
jgi:hypothetical protein